LLRILAGEHAVLTESRETISTSIEADVERAYRETRGAICSYLVCLGLPPAQAQEVTQEVYLRLYQTMRKGEQIMSTRAWLFRVAYNLGVRARSAEKVFRALPPNLDRFPATSSESPEQSILDREKLQRVQEAVASLSPQQRNCLYLRSEGLRYREIADVLGVSSSTVNEFLRRAITRLAEVANG
jgi:RNA polymerase sigma-70 factor (ECF subfamily)